VHIVGCTIEVVCICEEVLETQPFPDRWFPQQSPASEIKTVFIIWIKIAEICVREFQNSLDP
jgi:hypothetical protein